MIRKEEVYKIGQLTKPHGVKGEIAFSFTDDVFDRVECDYLIVLLDGILVPFYLEEYRFKSDTVALVKFERIDTAEQARRFTNVEVYFPVKLAEQVTDRELTWNYFVGFRVKEVKHGDLGEITMVDESTINTLFVIDHQGTELLLPAQEEFIVNIDHEQRVMEVQVPDGLLQMEEAEEV
jgi:16S rRNA processing protein RimM